MESGNSLNSTDHLRNEKIRQLFANQTIGSIANVVNAAILVLIQWPIVSRSRLGAWLAATLAITIGRSLMRWFFFRCDQGQTRQDKWQTRFLMGTFFSGVSWGAAGVFLFPTQSVVHQMFTAFTIGGMVAGASAAYSALRRAYLAFSLPAMLPIIAYSFSLHDSIHISMGAMMLLFLILMTGTCFRNHGINEGSMTLRFENKDLVSYLSDAKGRTEDINRKLTAENAQRQRIEIELEKHQKKLESIVEKRTAELEKRNHELGLEIKERQYAQAALKNSEERYRLLVENANIGIALIRNDTVLFANGFAATITGYSEDEIQRTSFLHFIHPDDRQMAADYHRKRLNGEAMPDSYQIRIVDKSGELHWLEITAVRLLYENEPAALSFFKDITQQRHLEVQVLQSEKMAAVGQLAAGVAHEINNPVGFVNSNLHTLKTYLEEIHQLVAHYQDLHSDLKVVVSDGFEDNSIATQMNAIDELATQIDLEYILKDGPALILESLEGADRIKNIVLDLKNFAHPGEQDGRPTDINRSIESTLNIVWNELKYHAIVTKEFAVLPEIFVHPQQINQVFMNLLVNAAQAIEDKGEIKIRTSVDDGFVMIRISDTGSGIPQKHLAKIFDPFFTTKLVGKGTGLGLNVSYNIIQKHNGTIAVDSEVGKGTTFTVRLPMQVDPIMIA